MQDKGVACPTNCASCGHAYEDLNHLLFECPFAIQVWTSAVIWYDIQHAAINSDSAVDTILFVSEFKYECSTEICCDLLDLVEASEPQNLG